MARIGRPKTYETKQVLLKAVKSYFRSISYEEPYEASGGGEEPRPTVRVWIKAPSMAGLYLYLGIGKSTWARYEKDEELAEATEYARLMMEDYWVGELSGKNATGAKFALATNYGWTDKMTVGVDEETRKDMRGAAMTMAEKLAVIKAAAMELGETVP